MSFSYIDNVPVKISENYKPLPKVFTIPQAVASRLNAPANYYDESPQFSYDFQLEKKVQTKIAEWRKCRQNERELRLERKERYEQQEVRDIENRHKELLTAISYPSAEDLSSESDNEEDCGSNSIESNTVIPIKKQQSEKITADTIAARSNFSTATSSFNTILQPTIVPHSTMHMSPSLVSPSYNSNSINYSDFEDDTSSPFDNIELKTINDLDILAQVLHNTHVQKSIVASGNNSTETIPTPNDDGADAGKSKNLPENNVSVTNENDELRIYTQDIPVQSVQQVAEVCGEANGAMNVVSNKFPPLYSNCYQSQPLATYNVPQQQQNHQDFLNYSNNYDGSTDVVHHNLHYNQWPINNCSYLYNNSNDLYANQTSYSRNNEINSSSTHTNTPLAGNITSFPGQQSPGIPSSLCDIDPSNSAARSKSKSVPDIVKELGDEIRSSKIRRSRNYSHTLDDVAVSEQTEADKKPIEIQKPMKSQYYTKLEAPTKKLARKICSMGFPMERVAKIAQVVGEDDKKIVEHLISLSELMDLGFDESEIFEALLKFDNNKEKALEFLIS